MGILNIDEHVEEHRLMAIRYPGKAVIVDTQQAEWGERTDATTGRPLVPLIETARDTCYFWTWPASNATARYGEHHIYVPIGSGTDYYGVILGVRAKSAYAVPFDCVHGIFRPGLHTRASACTRVGSWSSNSNVGALWGDYYYSVAAGATISASVTGSVVAVQHYLASNGGYAVVSVDGSYTFNSPLPVFSSQDYANGLCRAADVGRHYLSCYAAAGWSLSQVIAEGLSSGAHTVTLEVTGTKAAAASDYRVYVEALIGCGPSDSVANANTHMVPLRRVCEMASPSGSAFYAVDSWAPAGSTDYQFLTSVHADNSNCKEVSVAGPTVYVDATDRSSPTLGTYYGGSMISWYQESQASHKANLATYVVNRKRTYVGQAGGQHPVVVDVTLQWLAAGTVYRGYPLMLPLGAYDFQARTTPIVVPDALWLGKQRLTAFAQNDDSITPYGNQDSLQSEDAPLLIGVYDDFMAWASLLSEHPKVGQLYAKKYRYALQDRADGLDKLYVADTYSAYRQVAVNETNRYVCGFGAGFIADMPA